MRGTDPAIVFISCFAHVPQKQPTSTTPCYRADVESLDVFSRCDLSQIDSPEKWRENMEMALEMFKAQKAMMQQQQQQAGDEDAGAADVDDLDDD